MPHLQAAALLSQQGILAALVLLVGAIVAAGTWMAVRIGARLAARTKTTLDDRLAAQMPAPVAVALGAAASRLALEAAAPRLDARAASLAGPALSAVFFVAAAVAGVRLLRIFLEQVGHRRPRLQPATRLGGRLVSATLYALAFLMVLSSMGISVTPLITALGIGALAVALALQDTLSNFFAGIWIQTGRSLQPGHYVRMDLEKLEGYVEEVGWRTTRLRLLSGSTIILPNAKFAQAIITDFNLPNPDLSVSLEFRIAYEADPDKVLAVLTEEGEACQKALPARFAPDSKPFASLNALEDDCLRFGVSMRAKEFVDQFAIQNDLRMRVLKRLRKEGIRIPYPTRHNYQEPVAAPPARRSSSAPGGLAPRARPARVRAKPAVAVDPREAEAEQAKRDIAVKQAIKGKPLEEPLETAADEANDGHAAQKE